MTMGFFLFGGLFLAWAFGRNNFSNVFGSAVGTGILSFKLAAILTGSFLLLGAIVNGSGTSATISSLMHFSSLPEACCFSLILALMMLLLTSCAIPASVAQIFIGALIGWNLALDINIPWDKVIDIILAWFYSPLIACVTAFLIFKGMRFCLKKYPVPLLQRDVLTRFFWIIVGSFTAYSLGANNMPVLIVPFAQVLKDTASLSLLFSVVVIVGCLMASRKVIKMVTHKLFPLSSLESLIVGFSGALTLLLFSFQNSVLPALPISISASLIGAIVGVSLAKGGYGLNGKTLSSIVASWIWAPLFSGLLCFFFISIMNMGGF